MLRLTALTALGLVVAMSSIAIPVTPAAACVSARAPFDSFSAAVPGAGTVVVGTVEGLAERESHVRFRLRIDEIVRGDAPAAMRFSGLRGSDALSACGDRSVVHAREGDRLALAMSAAVPGQPLEVDAVAFVGKSRPDRQDMPRIERWSIHGVRRLAGKTADGSASRRPYDAGVAADNLITRRVARGVARVSARGTKHDLAAVRRLDVSPEGRVWAATRDSAFQLAQRKDYSTKDKLPPVIGSMLTGPDGHALADGRGVSLFVEKRGWRRLSESGGSDALWWPLMTSAGVIWALSMRGPWRLDSDAWTPYGWDVADPPAGCLDRIHPLRQSDCDVTRLAEAPDGSVWLGYERRDGSGIFGGGLRRFDGRMWGEVPDPMAGMSFGVSHLTSYPGGPVWALLVPQGNDEPIAGDRAHSLLARWDGEAWTRYELPSEFRAGRRSQPRELVAGPDGVVWLSRPLASFDGDTWRRYDTPARTSSRKPRIEDLSISPDGSAWMVVRDIVKWKTTRPDGIYVLDPARARSRDEMAAVVIAAGQGAP